MPHMITRNRVTVEQNWLDELAHGVSDPETLLKKLAIPHAQWPNWQAARAQFAQRVPQALIDRMQPGNIDDPILKQVLPIEQELFQSPGFTADPLEEHASNQQAGILHKYKNRALMILKGGCAVNCRYCFRRHFPYADNPGGKRHWQQAIDYIAQQPEINEIILSGGDPLMAKDHELDWLIAQLEPIGHIKRLRIHSRLPVVIPSRVTDALCDLLQNTRFQVLLVTHINHPQEIDEALASAMRKLKNAGVTLLNQGVLLKGINDDAQILATLSNRLFDIGILPYYLHLLDKVQGAAHFLVSDDRAREIMANLVTLVSGYLVPKLTREIGGRPSKTLIDLHLE
ncbi:L-lysine 2,3-aminomutase [Vibrio stylophorae]|uniref:L-lysine 2,3-aminomutase n=1 Tax=Vibrio stylophorae TaxID=659351 RepID=A0ABM8ZQ57_9VIBR|nr:EF-P beta-lysylation protein EpmB [Vibrio stylophorae]CAH0532425.1 L-lysine 2,3-aminomutase [Vibrio stylophorae]